jgi:signal transduction histidine kinase
VPESILEDDAGSRARPYSSPMRPTVAPQRSLDRLAAGVADSPLLVDGLIALGLTALSLITVIGGARDIGQIEPVSLVLLVLQTLPLLLRRRFPVAVFVVTLTATVVHVVFATAAINTTIGSLVALFTVAERHDRRGSGLAALAAGAAIGILIVAKAGLPAGLSGFVQSELSVFVVWVLGTWARERRRYVGTVEERALRAEREREALAERAVADERERIAREMHDVVTHHVSVIVIQAGAGLRALDRRPEDARAALAAIDASGRRALADMRRMLGILGRAPGAVPGTAGGVSDEALAPMPGLDRLGELLEHVRSAGLPVELAVRGDPRPLDQGVELAAYRIIQEALTNSLKHARGARAHVTVEYEARALELCVDDQGGSGDRGIAESGGHGHGLIGMRERVALFGGRLETGPTGTGFRISARLPLDPPPAAGA